MLNSQKGNKFKYITKAQCCDNCLWFSFLIQKKKSQTLFSFMPSEAEWKADQSYSFLMSSVHLSRHTAGPEKVCVEEKMLGGTVNHRELLCLQFPFLEELRRAETMALLWSCVSSTSSTAGDGWWVKRAADFGCTTLKYFIKDGKRPCTTITQQILPFAVEQTNSFLSAG